MYRGPHVDDPKKSVTVVLPLDRYQALARLAEQNSYSLPAYIRQVGAAEPYPVPGGGAIRPKFPPGFTGQEFLCPLPHWNTNFPLTFHLLDGINCHGSGGTNFNEIFIYSFNGYKLCPVQWKHTETPRRNRPSGHEDKEFFYGRDTGQHTGGDTAPTGAGEEGTSFSSPPEKEEVDQAGGHPPCGPSSHMVVFPPPVGRRGRRQPRLPPLSRSWRWRWTAPGR